MLSEKEESEFRTSHKGFNAQDANKGSRRYLGTFMVLGKIK